MSRQFTYYGSFASVAYYTDLFGIPNAAYSLRKLSPNSVYSGAAIRIRRSSDNTEQDINFVSSSANAKIDTSALLSFVGANNGFVTTWYDQSGNNRNAYQTTGQNQPTIVVNGDIILLNNEASILFKGDLKRLIINNFFSAFTNLGLFNVQKINNTSNQIAFVLLDGVRAVYLPWVRNGEERYLAGTSDIFNNGAVSQKRQLVTFYSDSNTMYLNLDSDFKASKATVAPTGQGSIGFGFQLAIAATSQDFYHQELIIYTTNIISEITAIETNINAYYNVF